MEKSNSFHENWTMNDEITSGWSVKRHLLREIVYPPPLEEKRHERKTQGEREHDQHELKRREGP